MQAIDRTAPTLPLMPTTPARQTHDYVRHGTTSLFAAFDVGSGSVIAQHDRQHRHQEFLRFLKLIDTEVLKDLDLHRPAPGAGQLRHPQDPTGAQLAAPPSAVPPALHPDQQLLAEPGRALVRRAHHPQAAPIRHRSVTELEADVRRWITRWNANPKPFVWTNQPTRSSRPSPPTAAESTTHDTRSPASRPSGSRPPTAGPPPAGRAPVDRICARTSGAVTSSKPNSWPIAAPDRFDDLLGAAGHWGSGQPVESRAPHHRHRTSGRGRGPNTGPSYATDTTDLRLRSHSPHGDLVSHHLKGAPGLARTWPSTSHILAVQGHLSARQRAFSPINDEAPG
jgi:hypothetical protein